MESIHFQHNALTAAEITTRRLCRLHRVRLFAPALCRVKRGSKVIVQGESRVLATPQQLIVLPADVELEVINQPENGLFCSDLLSLTPELLTAFKTRYVSEPPPGRLTSLCAPVTTELAFMWQSVLQAVREGLSPSLQQHQTMACCWPCTRRVMPARCSSSGSRICRRRFDNWSCCRQRKRGACRGWRKCSFSASPRCAVGCSRNRRVFARLSRRCGWPMPWGSCRPLRGPSGKLRRTADISRDRALPRASVSTMVYCQSTYAE